MATASPRHSTSAPRARSGFDALTYRGQQHRLRRLAEVALAAYGLAEARYRLVKYEDNAVYQVTGVRGERFVLRLTVTDDESQTALLSWLHWLLALRRDTALVVPEPIPAADGALVIPISVAGLPSARCCLLRWVPGQGLGRLRTHTAFALAGEAAARLHWHASRWTPSPGFTRPRYDLNWLFGPTATLHAPRDIAALDRRGQEVVAMAAQRIRTAVAALGTGADTFGLLHADLNLDNFLYHDARIGIIDFADSGWGYYLYDLATTLCSLRHTVRDRRQEARLRASYLTGYERVRPLPSRYTALLPAFMALRELVIMTFILESGNLKVQGWGATRIAEAVHNLQVYLRNQPPDTS